MLENLKNKKILILGFGREGKDAFLFLRKMFPKKIIGIADRNEKIFVKDRGAVIFSGKDYLKSIKKHDVVIKSPGIPYKVLPKGVLSKVTTQTEIFLNNCPGKIIGITGTKGKSTTSSLIYEILKRGGIKAKLVGNIGKPVLLSLLKAKEDNVFVYEMSSHQLYKINKSPQIAVLLNIYPEHLDYYKDFEEYAKAKANITLKQKKDDFFIFNYKNREVLKISRKTKAKKIPIKGEYFELNKNAAKAVARIFNIPEKVMNKTIASFKTLPHRLELVGTFRGITFYNDSLATIPQATIAALKILGNRVETIMLGGFDRNIDFKELAREILKSRIKTIILFPTTGEKILKSILSLPGKKKPEHFFTDNMMDAVKIAYQKTGKGRICLLSTASPSFSMFRDYKEKGDTFKKYVKRLS